MNNNLGPIGRPNISGSYSVPNSGPIIHFNIHGAQPAPIVIFNPPTRPRQSPQLIVAAILSLVTQNGMATLIGVFRPHNHITLNRYRADLLVDPFFDRAHRSEELRPFARPDGVLWMDLVVLLARLMRVLMRASPLTAEEEAERIEVRNLVVVQPFFDPTREGGINPFSGDDDFVDEGLGM